MLHDSATIPPELGLPIPRGAHLKRNGVHMAVVAWIILAFGVGLGISEAIHIVREGRHRAELRNNSREAAGVVTKEGRANTVYYAFTANGTTFTDNARAPNSQWYRLEKNGPIPVRYLAANPAIHHPAAWEWSIFLEWNPLLAITMALFLSGVFFASLHGDRKLIAEGTPAVGTVTSCSPWSRGGFIVRYEFRTADGMALRGKGWPENSYEIGAPICILYLSRNPMRNKSYPMTNYRADG